MPRSLFLPFAAASFLAAPTPAQETRSMIYSRVLEAHEGRAADSDNREKPHAPSEKASWLITRAHWKAHAGCCSGTEPSSVALKTRTGGCAELVVCE